MRRNLRDYIHEGFFARDKASLAKIIKDAEEDIPPELIAKAAEGGHAEPDGDEGDQKHSSAVHVHIEHGKATDSVDSRLTKIEDTVNNLDAKMTSFFDSVKDGDLPPWLQKGGDDDKKDDDDKTKDAGELGGEEGAQTAQALSSAEPDLMEADPALKTGPSKMGDAAYVAAVSKGLAKLMKDTRARAEMLLPGIKFATMDAKATKPETVKLLCDMRRDVLKKAATTEAGKKLLGRAYTADAIGGLDCGAVRLLFVDATDRAREANNGQGKNFQHGATMDVRAYRDHASSQLRSINERNAAFWDKQAPGGRLN